jgi:hypothetical protein
MIMSSHMRLLGALGRLFERVDKGASRDEGSSADSQAADDERSRLQFVARWERSMCRASEEDEAYRCAAQMLRVVYQSIVRTRSGIAGFAAWLESQEHHRLP